MSTDFIDENLINLRASIAAATDAAGRAPNSIRLIAVSKTVTADVIKTAHDHGQRAFGENRVQELEIKVPRLPNDCEWHLIGHLQKNKVRSAVQLATWIHSVDSASLLKRIDRIAAEEQRHPQILLQVNVASEDSKFGLNVSEVKSLLELALQCQNVECRGFMTIAPFDIPPKDLHHIFATLRNLRDELAAEFGVSLPELSMGMSGDFPIAIEEGATMVRIGTAIFGKRS